METRFYAEYARVEAEHWWFRGRHAILRALLPVVLPTHPDTRILDVGFGTGNMLQFYEPYGAVVGCDMAAEAIAFARDRVSVPLVQGTATALPVADGSFDLVSMLDIVEHVADDETVVAEGARCLKPGGVLLAAVPAFQFLWGPQDTISHHQKRYRLGELTALMTRAGLTIERATYCNMLLFPPIAAVRMLRRLLPSRNGAELRSDFTMTGPGRFNSFLAGLFSLEAVRLRHGALPVGVTALAVGRKPARAGGQ